MNWILPWDAPLLTSLTITSGKAALILLLAIAVRAFLRKGSASSRYFLISAAVILVATLPLLTLMAPDWKLPLPTMIQSHLPPEFASSPLPNAAIDGPNIESAEGSLSASGAPPAPVASQSHYILLYLWLLGTVLAAGRVLLGLAGCARIRRQATRVDSPHILDLVGRATAGIGLRRYPEVMTSGRIVVPYVSGLIRPVVFLPLDALRWTDDRLSSALLHELAHIKRKDHITWPLLSLAVCWLWFHPILWLALAQMKRDRERACDDYAIARGGSVVRYARHLLNACASLQSATRLTPIASWFTRRHDVEERIRYMLNHGIDRRPIRRAQQLVFAVLTVIVAVPLISLTGFSSTVALHDVTPQERDVVLATLDAFYARLSSGSDFEFTRDNFLTSDYFDAPHLTLEYLDEAARRPPFENTLSLIREAGVGIAKEVHCRVTALERDGEDIVVTQRIDIIADRVRGAVAYEDDEGNIIRVPQPAPGQEVSVEECRLVDAMTQQIRLRFEDDVWKVAQFDDGVSIMQMDTDNPFGPIFLVWMGDIDPLTTPFGPGVFKVIPRDLVPDARNAAFVLEE